MGRPHVYLAGPMVFEPDPERLFSVMKKICDRHAIKGVSPLDNQLGLESAPPGHALAAKIVAADIALMRRLDGGLFCLDGFRRGPDMDPGTAFEIGFMHALGKPLAGWTRDPRDYPARVRAFFGGEIAAVGSKGASGARSGAVRDPDGILIHSEGCFQNAMAQIGIERSGGAVYADADWEMAFDAAAARLASLLKGDA